MQHCLLCYLDVLSVENNILVLFNSLVACNTSHHVAPLTQSSNHHRALLDRITTHRSLHHSIPEQKTIRSILLGGSMASGVASGIKRRKREFPAEST